MSYLNSIGRIVDAVSSKSRASTLAVYLPDGEKLEVFLRAGRSGGVYLDGPPRYAVNHPGRKGKRPGVRLKGAQKVAGEAKVGDLTVVMDERAGNPVGLDRGEYEVLVPDGSLQEISEKSPAGFTITIASPEGREAWFDRTLVAKVQQLVGVLRESGATVIARRRDCEGRE